MHGNIWRDRCTRCGASETRDVAEPVDDGPVYCRSCGAMARPDVVWFGEMLPGDALETAQNALERAAAVIVVGTSNRVYPAAALVDAAVDSSRPVIEINPDITPVSDAVDIRIASAASEALPAMLTSLDAISANG
ncbi:transcriptional regulator [Salinisphaera hydrothermalis C41B8]|uniref:protein acetyllysine N-acetyltransferase n=1 Tax=Salinisphaera hydrothermalis (strain C41B8) TaxID=1304275 RepID=A0A084IQD4_SALHC|nr:transcriptional regulator [Salinisphaera hydrothermalis C41B8]